ncbi:MAG: hypothetical protein EXR05_01980 [Acetobacteraceae bacterium]|nr:hypothetical protein [Acetobacteraceae bacterium]MSP29695.1 hypothetical protein [Acetobacteraceae bacterium]
MHAEQAFDASSGFARYFLGVDIRQPCDFLAQDADFGRAKQVQENQKTIAIELRKLQGGEVCGCLRLTERTNGPNGEPPWPVSQ